MGDWVIGAIINLIGSIGINCGTNLLKLGHDQRDKLQLLNSDVTDKLVIKPIIYFPTWRFGILIFALGNSLNFISFGYAAQSLLAALGSIQFISNIAFSYFILNKSVTVKIVVATIFIVLGNIFLVSFGNHQSPVYTPDELEEKYNNIIFLIYVLVLFVIVIINHCIYRNGVNNISVFGSEPNQYWCMLLPFSYATISAAIGSCSVLFAKSLSNLLRLSMSSDYQLHSWFTYSMVLLFLSTAGFWMARLNEGLSMFDAILIVPMFQIAWTFFSMCTGFIYFQEYQVFDSGRITMFLLGMVFVFIGISLLAPNENKSEDPKTYSGSSSTSQGIPAAYTMRIPIQTNEAADPRMRTFTRSISTKMASIVEKAKTACTASLGLSNESINASSVLVMPMVSSKTTGFRGTFFDRSKFNRVIDIDDLDTADTISLLQQNHD
ncbi:hypothetical protein ZOSMA_36G00680 [Zostera marina]|uniref:Probable magnesium transporter n=1 Tax=Zostera marina TaxID=29655 RepID=A0A0K9P5Z8_ZOSMR|nr:hypothetical protein ZOSMA_36G00680 [Zostera marina]